MNKKQRIIKYIFRSWEDEPEPAHPRFKILPHIFKDLLAISIGIVILYSLLSYLYNLI
jgi:hypothetical protein